ncbi:hypothetical protein CKJ90_32810, partial [Klebsiella pneumoniae]
FHAQPVACPDCGPRLEWRAEGEALDGEARCRRPADRRFHAQPVACPDCGPRLEWRAEGEALDGEARCRR